MGKLNNQDIAEIRGCYLKGQTSDYIAQQFDISGQRVRQLVKENNWKELRNSSPATVNGKARELALIEAKSADNFRKNNPVVREFILSELGKGVSLTAAAKRVGIDPKTLTSWRQKDPEYHLRCHEAQADFISSVEALACGVSTPKEALTLLGRHPLTKKEWNPEQDKNSIKIEFSFTREDQEDRKIIDADFKEVPQIEGS